MPEQLFVVKNVSPHAHRIRCYDGKVRELGFGDKAVVDRTVASLCRSTGEFEVKAIEWEKIIEAVVREELQKRVPTIQQFRDPSRQALLYAIFPHNAPHSLQRWFMSQLVRLSLANYQVFVYSPSIPRFARHYFSTHNIAWLTLDTYHGRVDFVIAASAKAAEPFARRFNARLILLSPEKQSAFETSNRFLVSRTREEKKFLTVLQSEAAPLPREVETLRRVSGLEPKILQPSDEDWQDDERRSRLLSASLFFINFVEDPLNFHEREADLTGCFRISVNGDAEMSLQDFLARADEARCKALVKAARERVPAEPRQLEPLRVEDIIRGTTAPEKERVCDIVILHWTSTHHPTGADRATLALYKHLSQNYDVELWVVSHEEKRGGILAGADRWLRFDTLAKSWNEMPVASLYIVTDTLIPLARENLPSGRIIGYLHCLHDLLDEKGELKPELLTGVSLLAPSRSLAEEIRDRYSLEVEHCAPKYDWPTPKDLDPASDSKTVFIPTLYNTAEDISFLKEIAAHCPDCKFLIGDCRAPKLAFEGVPNIEIKFFKDVRDALREAKVVLCFSSIPATFSISAWESLAAGRLLIAEDKPPFTDLPERFRLPRDPVLWAEKIREYLNIKGHAWGALRGRANADFKRYIKVADRWDAIITNYLEDQVGISVSSSPWAGVDAALKAMQEAIGRTDPRFPVVSVMEQRVPRGAIGFMASSLSQLPLDGQTNIVNECAERLIRGEFSVVICWDEAFARLVNRLVGRRLCFALPTPARRIFRKDGIKPHRYSVFFATPAPRKDFMFNLILAAEAGAPAVEMTDRTPTEFQRLAERLGLIVHTHPLYHDDAYATFLSEVKVGFQFTLAESFNYTAFEHFLVGTPCLVSEQARCIFELPEDFHWMIINERDFDGAIEAVRRAEKMSERDRQALANAAHRAANSLNIRFRGAMSRVLRIAERRMRSAP